MCIGSPVVARMDKMSVCRQDHPEFFIILYIVPLILTTFFINGEPLRL